MKVDSVDGMLQKGLSSPFPERKQNTTYSNRRKKKKEKMKKKKTRWEGHVATVPPAIAFKSLGLFHVAPSSALKMWPVSLRRTIIGSDRC